MEIYTLDSLLRRTTVTDLFESCIWTERWAEIGDFELLIAKTRENADRFSPGTRVAMNESMRVMTVETVEDKTAEDGKKQLLIKGRSIEQILEDRVAWNNPATLTTSTVNGDTTVNKWVITATPGNVARTLFDTACRNGALSVYDKIPYLMPGTIMPTDTITEPVDVIDWEIEPIKDLYEAIKEICDIYELGFRLVRNYDMSQLYFDIYAGTNRTTRQDDFTPVVFSESLDNLQNTNAMKSQADFKNVAYVWSEEGYVVVYAPGADPEIEGLDRKALHIRADKLRDPDNPAWVPTQAETNLYLTRLGQNALAKHQAWSAFDGEHDKSSGYIYGVHYNLGDLVEMRDSSGGSNNMRVTEQIFVSDEQGDRSYPTLAINLTITPGSWLGWDYNQVWVDLDANTTDVWANQI